MTSLFHGIGQRLVSITDMGNQQGIAFYNNLELARHPSGFFIAVSVLDDHSLLFRLVSLVTVPSMTYDAPFAQTVCAEKYQRKKARK